MNKDEREAPVADTGAGAGAGQFVQTRWTVVINAKEGSFEALCQLCEWYREPLRRHILRRGFQEASADDLIQEFLSKKLVEGSLFRSVKERANAGKTLRFRTFLLTCLDRFLIDRRRRRPDPSDPAVGVMIGVPPAEDEVSVDMPAPPMTREEEVLARTDWMEAILRVAAERHRDEYRAAGRSLEMFAALDTFSHGDPSGRAGSEWARRFGMSENAFYVAKHRFAARRTYWLKEVIRETVSNPEDWEEEVRELLESGT
ncbi:MAG: hypothetical protein JNK85_16875 [Verrucomicrobiales bacterium]|nr:hypothetical protein [Verrucomicrobiales bacterium]